MKEYRVPEHVARVPLTEFKHVIAESAKLDIVVSGIDDRTHLESRDRFLPCYVMSYMKDGHSVIHARDSEYRVHEGELVIVPPRLRHSHDMGNSRRTVFLWWHFNLTVGGHLDVLRFIKAPMVLPVTNRADFELRFGEYMELNAREESTLSYHILRRAKALEVMAYLLDSVSIVNHINDHFADVPDDFVSMLQDIIDEPSTWRHVNDLAERYNYHPAYLTARFRHFFGITPGKLGRNLLYERALLLLHSRDATLAEVAEELGFSETSSFTRFFKSVEGITPSAMRRRDGSSGALLHDEIEIGA